jgi:Mn2+/Fe2+ NRAMP family transporter
MIVQRDAFDMAASLKRLTGDDSAAQLLFGVGVLGMAVSTIIILMLINGFVLTEVTGRPGHKGLHLAGCFLASIVGAVGSNTLWKGDARTWLAVPTSMFAFVLLPIAYIAFALMMNSKSLMGDDRLSGGKRLKWNLLMLLAVAFATAGSLWSMSLQSYAKYGFISLGAFVALALIVQLARRK